jgi:hypothetical protein
MPMRCASRPIFRQRTIRKALPAAAGSSEIRALAEGAAAWRFCQRPRGKRSTGAESMWCEEHHALGHQQPGKGRAA